MTIYKISGEVYFKNSLEYFKSKSLGKRIFLKRIKPSTFNTRNKEIEYEKNKIKYEKKSVVMFKMLK